MARPTESAPSDVDKLIHDLRGPLTALEVATEDLSALPEHRRNLILAAVKRFRELLQALDPDLR